MLFIWSLAACMFLGGIMMLLYQGYFWLQNGYALQLSVIDVLVLFDSHAKSPGASPWIYYPESWLGLHKLLSSTPFAAFLIVTGLLILFVGTIVVTKLWESQERAQEKQKAQKATQEDSL